MELLIIIAVNVGDTCGLAYVQFRQGNHGALCGAGSPPATVAVRYRHTVGALPGMAQKRTDAVHKIGVYDVLELTGACLKLGPKYIVNESFCNPV